MPRCFVERLFNPPTLLGKWEQAEPSGCATKCGVAAGKSGTPGAVTCSTSSCNADTKPAAKQCPKTVDCGTCASSMPIPNRQSHRLLLLHHHHAQSSQSTNKQPTHGISYSFLAIWICSTCFFVYDDVCDLLLPIILRSRLYVCDTYVRLNDSTTFAIL